MTSPRAAAAFWGATAGLLAGAGAAWLSASDPGRGRGAQGSLRGDLDALVARVSALELRLASFESSIRSLEEKSAAAANSSVTVEQLRGVANDAKALRDSASAELEKVEARLSDLRLRIDELSGSSARREGPPTEDEENEWAAKTRDADPGVRFSALTMLGRARTERSVQASKDGLADEQSEVVWQALRNLARFKERAAAPQAAQKLDHADVAVRSAAYDALLAMGAPRDTGFDAAASAEKRKAAVDALKKWAEGP